MTTPELANYVSQARAAGQTDDQINQTLAQQGWQSTDIGEALGSAVAGASAATPAVKKPFPKTIIVAIVLLLLLLLIGGWVFSYVKSFGNNKLQQLISENNNNSSSGTQNNDNNSNNTGNSNSSGFLGGTDRTCGNVDVAKSKEHSASDLNDSLKNFPSDFKMPDGARHVATVGTEPLTYGGQTLYGIFYFCTQLTKDEFRNSIRANNPDWFTTSQGLFLLPTKVIGNESHVLINSSTDAGDGNTLIKIMYSSYAQKQ